MALDPPHRWTAAQVARFKPLLFILCLYPLARWLWLASQGDLTANPAQFLILSSGLWALIMLLATLTITPVRRLIKQPALISLRRMLGLYSFFYTVLHIVGWALWEHGMLLGPMWQDVLSRTFVTVGVLATIPMIALALTSTRSSMKRLGSRWQTLHNSVYPVAILSVWHFWLVRAGKNDFLEAYIYGALLCVLLGIRLIFSTMKRVARSR